MNQDRYVTVLVAGLALGTDAEMAFCSRSPCKARGLGLRLRVLCYEGPAFGTVPQAFPRAKQLDFPLFPAIRVDFF